MPRYFFHLRFGQRVVRDEEGIELPNSRQMPVLRAKARPEKSDAVGRGDRFP